MRKHYEDDDSDRQQGRDGVQKPSQQVGSDCLILRLDNDVRSKRCRTRPPKEIEGTGMLSIDCLVFS